MPKLYPPNGLISRAYVPLNLGSFREGASDDVQALAAHGGILCKDSTPIYEAVNGDTDGQLRLRWAASDSNAIMINVPVPDIDVAQNLELHMYVAMSGATDTPVIDLDSFFMLGDTKVSDASAALSDTIAEVVITIAAADIPAGAQVVALELTPAAHTTDAIHLYAAWLEYERDSR